MKQHYSQQSISIGFILKVLSADDMALDSSSIVWIQTEPQSFRLLRIMHVFQHHGQLPNHDTTDFWAWKIIYKLTVSHLCY